MLSGMLSCMGSGAALLAVVPVNGDDGQQAFNVVMLLLTVLQILLGLG